MVKRISPLDRMIALRNSLLNDTTLSASQRNLIQSLFLYSDEHGLCHPSYDQLRAVTGMGRSTISKCINGLVENGWLSYVKGCGSKQKANSYQISREKIGIDTKNVVEFPTPQTPSTQPTVQQSSLDKMPPAMRERMKNLLASTSIAINQ